MIEALGVIADKLLSLLEISRVRRRELLLDVITPLFDDLKVIHSEYLIELSAAREQCTNNPEMLKQVLTHLDEKRLFKEAERQQILSTCERLLARKWRPEVRQFLSSAQAYLQLHPPIARLSLSAAQPVAQIREEIRHTTGYSRVIQVLKYIIGAPIDQSAAQTIVVEIIDETLTSLRASWVQVSGDFAEIQVKSR